MTGWRNHGELSVLNHSIEIDDWTLYLWRREGHGWRWSVSDTCDDGMLPVFDGALQDGAVDAAKAGAVEALRACLRRKLDALAAVL